MIPSLSIPFPWRSSLVALFVLVVTLVVIFSSDYDLIHVEIENKTELRLQWWYGDPEQFGPDWKDPFPSSKTIRERKFDKIEVRIWDLDPPYRMVRKTFESTPDPHQWTLTRANFGK